MSVILREANILAWAYVTSLCVILELLHQYGNELRVKRMQYYNCEE